MGTKERDETMMVWLGASRCPFSSPRLFSFFAVSLFASLWGLILMRLIEYRRGVTENLREISCLGFLGVFFFFKIASDRAFIFLVLRAQHSKAKHSIALRRNSIQFSSVQLESNLIQTNNVYYFLTFCIKCQSERNVSKYRGIKVKLFVSFIHSF
jgi:hypothetical protein